MQNRNHNKIKSKTRTGLLLISLIVLTALAYANSFKAPLIFDDHRTVLENPNLRSLWPLSKAMSAPKESAPAGRPVVSLSLALNYAFCGTQAWGYHFVNLFIHILAGLTLYGIIRLTLQTEQLKTEFGPRAAKIAWVIAAIWLVHPIQTESVTYISQRTESLMGLFFLLTLYTAIRAGQSKHTARWSLLSVLCCACGMASKETMAAAPLMVLLYDRAFFAGSFASALRNRGRFYAALAGTWIVLLVLMLSGPRPQTVGFSHGVSALDYAMNQCIIIPRYIRLMFWPHPLALCYGLVRPVAFSKAAPYAAGLAVLLIAALAVFSFKPKLGFIAAWFFVILAPTSSFIPIIPEVGAERRMYLPSAALIVLCVFTANALLRGTIRRFRHAPQRSPNPDGTKLSRVVATVSAITIVLLLTLTTLKRNDDYRSEVAIWQSAVKATPQNPYAYMNLAEALREADRTAETVIYLEKALELDPDSAELNNNLGATLQQQGKFEQAMARYQKALELDPGLAPAHDNLGTLLKAQGRLAEAIAHYHQALTIAADNANTHSNLALALVKQGNFDEGMEHFAEAMQLDPASAKIFADMAFAFQWQGDLEQALNYYEKSLQIDPYNAEVHYGIATAVQAQNNSDLALSHYRKAIELKPDHINARNNLAITLQLQGKLDEAIVHYRRVLQLDPGLTAAYYNLGTALQVQGNLNEATEAFRGALQTDPNYTQAYTSLIAALQAQGKTDEAIEQVTGLLKLQSQNADAQYKLALVLMMRNNKQQAIEHFRNAIELKPDWAAPLNSLAWLLATGPERAEKNRAEAVSLAERACELTEHKDSSALDTLAAAYGSVGNFEKAVGTAQKAIDLAEAAGNKKTAEQIKQRLELYKKHRPYRE